MHQKRVAQFALACSCLVIQQIYNTKSALAETSSVIEADAKMVENCKFMGTTTGYSLWGSRKNAVKDALKKAAKMGATHLILGEINTDSLGSQYTTAKTYQCDPTASLGTTPQPPQGINTAPVSESAPNKQDLYKVSSETTVFINGKSTASGVILAKEGTTYYVLTAKHAIADKDAYVITTHDGKSYSVDYTQIKKLASVDLAVIRFKSSQSYPVARLGNSDKIKQGDNVYVSGWPGTEQAITKRTHLVTDGRIVGLQKGDTDGYELMYGNSTAPGMSGGPVLDSNGLVVGIHGRAAGNKVSGKVGINLGIPINLFLRLAPETGLNMKQLGLKAGK